MSRRTKIPAPVGASSLLVIFSVLCFTAFAMLTLSTVKADERLADASCESVKAYYKADCEAEEILAKLRLGMSFRKGIVMPIAVRSATPRCSASWWRSRDRNIRCISGSWRRPPSGSPRNILSCLM